MILTICVLFRCWRQWCPAMFLERRVTTLREWWTEPLGWMRAGDTFTSTRHFRREVLAKLPFTRSLEVMGEARGIVLPSGETIYMKDILHAMHRMAVLIFTPGSRSTIVQGIHSKTLNDLTMSVISASLCKRIPPNMFSSGMSCSMPSRSITLSSD